MKTLRISHPAFSGAKNAETIRFYTELLGMELVLRQPNLDYPSEEHLFFHVGSDNVIAYFVPRDEAAAHYEQAKSGSGWMDHLAIDVEEPTLAEARERLVAGGVEVDGPIDRGYERSIYFKDPNGVTVEFLAWITPPPARDVAGGDHQSRTRNPRKARRGFHRGRGHQGRDCRADELESWRCP